VIDHAGAKSAHCRASAGERATGIELGASCLRDPAGKGVAGKVRRVQLPAAPAFARIKNWRGLALCATIRNVTLPIDP
jgi:hypothetical protein